ncbi:MAG: ion transporter [Thioalkalivibrionaceae bacterium]
MSQKNGPDYQSLKAHSHGNSSIIDPIDHAPKDHPSVASASASSADDSRTSDATSDPIDKGPERARSKRSLRHAVTHFVEARITQRFVIALILLNAVTLGFETSGTVMAFAGDVIRFFDRAILLVFTFEVALKFFAYRMGFFKRPWAVFDFIVVAIAWIPTTGPLQVLRVLRLLRLVSMVPTLRSIVGALLKAIPGLVSIFGLLLLVFYVAAIIATGLFRDSHPEWFGTLGASMYTLFQVMTLESWSMGIARPVIEVHPWAWAFFVPFILIATFTVLNLFIAIIVDAMQRMHEQQIQDEEARLHAAVEEHNQVLHGELIELQKQTSALNERLARMQRMIEESARTTPTSRRSE